MAYDLDLAERVRAALADTPDVAQKTMPGGLGVLVDPATPDDVRLPGYLAAGVEAVARA